MSAQHDYPACATFRGGSCTCDEQDPPQQRRTRTKEGVLHFLTREQMAEKIIRMDAALAVAASEGVTVGKYDNVLRPFLLLMGKELHANSRKGDRPGWLAMDANTALLEVYWHVAKLSAAVKNNDVPAIQEHSADVANMAMMVLDVCGGLSIATHLEQPGSRS